MRLFEVPAGQRVRITSRLIRWVEHQSEQVVNEGVQFEATTTNRYFYYKSKMRRLLVNHTLEFSEYGVWQGDTESEVLEGELSSWRNNPPEIALN